MAMRILPMLTIIATVALSACADPYIGPPRHYSGISPYGPEQSTPSQVASRAPISPPTPTRRSGIVPIEYYEGQPMVRISFPGIASFRCVLDTGASDLVIPLPFMLKLADNGLNPNTDIQWLGGGVAELAGGSKIRNVHIRLREIDIGLWQMKNVAATIIDNGDCLLGMSVLTRFGHPSIDFANKQLVLAD